MERGAAHTLVVGIGYHPRGLRVSLSERSGSALSTVSPLFIHPVDLGRLHELNRELVSALNQANRHGGLDPGAFDVLRRRGQMLFDEALPDTVKDRLRKTELRDLVLELDEDLVFLPWELCHTGQGFLCLLFNVGRIVRTKREVVGSARRLSATGPRSMLVLCDPRSDLLASYYEGVSLRDEIERRAPALRVALQSSEVTVASVQSVIRDFDVLHFAGHAELAPDAGGWRLSDGNLTAEHVFKLAGGAPLPSLVFANACASGQLDVPEAIERDIYGLAHAFLLAGVRHYIGTLWDVPDESSCPFALAFYRALLQGETVGRSLVAARGELLSRYGHESVLWAAYVLYGDPNASLWPPPAGLASGNLVHFPPPLPGLSSHAGGNALAEARASGGRTDGNLPRVQVRGSVASPIADFVLTPFQSAAQRAVPFVMGAALALIGAVTFLLVRAESRSSPEAVFTAPVESPSLPVAPHDFKAPPRRPPSRLHTDLEVRAQLLDSSGHVSEVMLADGSEVPVGSGVKLRLELTDSAWCVVFHITADGAITPLFQRTPREWAPGTRAPEVELPDSTAWYSVEAPAGPHTILVAASDTPPEHIEDLEAELSAIHRRVAEQSPAHRIPPGSRVRIGAAAGAQETPVTVTSINRHRLNQSLEARARKSFATAHAITIFGR